jgi:hypothetical protein
MIASRGLEVNGHLTQLMTFDPLFYPVENSKGTLSQNYITNRAAISGCPKIDIDA